MIETQPKAKAMPPKRNLDLRLLAYFQKTAEVGNITRAAKALNVAQPTLSKALQLLEHQLGVSLLQRHPHGVTPTVIGARLLRHARAVMAQVSDAAEEVEMLRLGEAGEVRIGAGPSWVRRILPEAVTRSLQERPGLSVTLFSGFDERLIERLRDGELDFVVAEKPLDDENESLGYEPLTSDALVVIARSGHRLAGQKHLSVQTVLQENWALPPSHTVARRKLDGRIVGLGATPAKTCIVSSSNVFLFEIVRRSDFLLYTTRSHLNTSDGAGLVELDVPDLVTARDAGIILRKPHLLTPAAEAVAVQLKEISRANPFN